MRERVFLHNPLVTPLRPGSGSRAAQLCSRHPRRPTRGARCAARRTPSRDAGSLSGEGGSISRPCRPFSETIPNGLVRDSLHVPAWGARSRHVFSEATEKLAQRAMSLSWCACANWIRLRSRVRSLGDRGGSRAPLLLYRPGERRRRPGRWVERQGRRRRVLSARRSRITGTTAIPKE